MGRKSKSKNQSSGGGDAGSSADNIGLQPAASSSIPVESVAPHTGTVSGNVVGDDKRMHKKDRQISVENPASKNESQSYIGKTGDAAEIKPLSSSGSTSKFESAHQTHGHGAQQKKEYVKKKDIRAARQQQTSSMLAPNIVTPPAAPPKLVQGQTSLPMSNLVTTMENLQIQPRMEPGTLGKKIKLGTNYLELDTKGLVKLVYHYDVVILPDLPKKILPKVFEEYRMKNYPNNFIAYDGKKNAYSTVVLKDNLIAEQTISYNDGKNKRLFKVTLTYAKTGNPIDLSSLKVKNYTSLKEFERPQRAIQVLDIVLRACFTDKNGITAGRSFFMKPHNPAPPLGDNFELWTGLFQSAILGYRPYLNVDIAHKAFPTAKRLLDLCFSVMRDRTELKDYEREKLHSMLKGVTITYREGDVKERNYKYQSLTGAASKEKFDCSGKSVTVVQYFKTIGIELKHPNMPCIAVGPANRPVWLPVELCTIKSEQAILKKCNESQTREMIKFSATSTIVRKSKICELLKQVKHNDSMVVKQFGVHINDGFINVEARILQAPDIFYENHKTVRVNNGSWMMDRCAFLRAAAPATNNGIQWAILCVGNLDSVPINNFGRNLTFEAQKLKLNLCKDFRIQNIHEFCKLPDIEKIMNGYKTENIELLVVIVPDSGPKYANIKHCAEVKVGVLTQCVKRKTIQTRNNPSTLQNLLLKINSKLNGVNHRLDPYIYFPEPFMFIGADVTHPSPDQNLIPSVVGVAASYDINAFKYHMSWRLQDPGTEIITDLENIVLEQLQFFKKQTNTLPTVILYYRDGVSEGQFRDCLNKELRAIRSATAKVGANPQQYNPRITYIVVQKRHHTRFFPKEGEGDRKNNNVYPGTVIDTEITHPNETQFFMVSHQSIQGVAKPTKYCVLRDDSALKMDKLQTLTYSLCHMFARCNRSVSYPAPTYYAHLAAYRGRIYIDGSGETIRMDDLKKTFTKLQIKDTIINKHPMYFI